MSSGEYAYPTSEQYRSANETNIDEQILNLKATLLRGNHTISVGYDMHEKFVSNLFIAFENGRWRWDSVDDFVNGNADGQNTLLYIKPVTGNLMDGAAIVDIDMSTFYIEDVVDYAWRETLSLTICPVSGMEDPDGQIRLYDDLVVTASHEERCEKQPKSPDFCVLHIVVYSSDHGRAYQTIAGVKTFSDNVALNGGLTIAGGTTAINSTVLTVQDINVELGVGAANDAAVDGGGIILKGGDDKKITWDNANTAWRSNKKFTFANNVGIGTDNPCLLYTSPSPRDS